MVNSEKIIRDTEVTILVAAMVVLLGTMAASFYKPDTYDFSSLSNCLEEWDQAIKDNWNPDFYEVECNALRTEIQTRD